MVFATAPLVSLQVGAGQGRAPRLGLVAHPGEEPNGVTHRASRLGLTAELVRELIEQRLAQIGANAIEVHLGQALLVLAEGSGEDERGLRLRAR